MTLATGIETLTDIAGDGNKNVYSSQTKGRPIHPPLESWKWRRMKKIKSYSRSGLTSFALVL